MSLQGSLEGFPLPDVLALLASTKKRGELRVAGHHGAGRVWLADGAVVGVEAGTARGPADALCQLLRVDTGSFTFDPAAEVPSGKPHELEPLLAEAQGRLNEWREIEAVVPSLTTRVQLADELPAAKVTVSANQWKVLRSIAASGSVEDVADVLDADEFHACQAVKRMVDAGLVVVVDGVDGERDNRRPSIAETLEPMASAVADAGPEEASTEEADAEETVAQDGEKKREIDPEELVTIPAHLRRARRKPPPEPTRPARRDPMAEAAARRRRELAGSSSAELVGATAAALTPENADALVQELADLGADVSQAKDVIAAASHAPTTEERAAALEGVLNKETGEPVNRAMLLKFLSSVRA